MKRYDLEWEWMSETPDGEYVEFKDHEAEMAKLRAENERLRAALASLFAPFPERPYLWGPIQELQRLKLMAREALAKDGE